MSDGIVIQNRSERPASGVGTAIQIDDARGSSPQVVELAVRPRWSGGRKPEAAPARRRTLRRLKGFLISTNGAESKVGFVIDNEVVEYILPSRYLLSNKITERGQPFEMDEFEERVKGALTTGTTFRPVAPADAGITKTVDLTEEQRALRDAILALPQLESKA